MLIKHALSMGEIKGESNKHALLMMNANGGPKTLCHPGEKECLCANDDEMFQMIMIV